MASYKESATPKYTINFSQWINDIKKEIRREPISEYNYKYRSNFQDSLKKQLSKSNVKFNSPKSLRLLAPMNRNNKLSGKSLIQDIADVSQIEELFPSKKLNLENEFKDKNRYLDRILKKFSNDLVHQIDTYFIADYKNRIVNELITSSLTLIHNENTLQTSKNKSENFVLIMANFDSLFKSNRKEKILTKSVNTPSIIEDVILKDNIRSINVAIKELTMELTINVLEKLIKSKKVKVESLRTEYSNNLDKIFKIQQQIQIIENEIYNSKQEELLLYNTKELRSNKQLNNSKDNQNEDPPNSHRDSARNKNVTTEKVTKPKFLNYAYKIKHEEQIKQSITKYNEAISDLKNLNKNLKLKINYLEYKIFILMDSRNDIRNQQFHHYKDILKEGKYLRTIGLKWVLNAIQFIKFPIYPEMLPQYLDVNSCIFVIEYSEKARKLKEEISKLNSCFGKKSIPPSPLNKTQTFPNIFNQKRRHLFIIIKPRNDPRNNSKTFFNSLNFSYF